VCNPESDINLNCPLTRPALCRPHIFVQCIETVEQHCRATRGIVDMRTTQAVKDLKVI